MPLFKVIYELMLGFKNVSLNSGFMKIFNSLQHHGDTLQPVFQMSVYNIVRKRKTRSK